MTVGGTSSCFARAAVALGSFPIELSGQGPPRGMNRKAKAVRRAAICRLSPQFARAPLRPRRDELEDAAVDDVEPFAAQRLASVVSLGARNRLATTPSSANRDRQPVARPILPEPTSRPITGTELRLKPRFHAHRSAPYTGQTFPWRRSPCEARISCSGAATVNWILAPGSDPAKSLWDRTRGWTPKPWKSHARAVPTSARGPRAEMSDLEAMLRARNAPLRDRSAVAARVAAFHRRPAESR